MQHKSLEFEIAYKHELTIYIKWDDVSGGIIEEEVWIITKWIIIKTNI